MTFRSWDRVTLLQRLRYYAEPDEDRTWLNRYFGPDYMGRAEFEHGNPLGRSIARMHRCYAQLQKQTLTGTTTDGRVVRAYFVGREQDAPVAQQLFQEQITDPYNRQRANVVSPYLREPSGINYAYDPDPQNVPDTYSGWMALHYDQDGTPIWEPFAFFREEVAADRWLQALGEPLPPPGRPTLGGIHYFWIGEEDA